MDMFPDASSYDLSMLQNNGCHGPTMAISSMTHREEALKDAPVPTQHLLGASGWEEA
jgi:hypothetical protein